MKHRIAGLAAALLFSPALLAAQPRPGVPLACAELPTPIGVPFFWAVVNGTCTDLSQFIVPGGQARTWTLTVPDMTIGFGRIRVSGTLNGDPFVNFGATTTNVGPGAITYAFLFGMPIVPAMYSSARSSVGVSVTSGANGSGSVMPGSIYPTFVSGYGTLGAAATNLGVDLGTAPCTVTGAGATHTCDYGMASNTFAPTTYDNLEALLTYSQADMTSVSSWSGAVTLSVSTVPEPTSMALLATGLVAMIGSSVRRRMKTRAPEV